jgi:hypothetical protein
MMIFIQPGTKIVIQRKFNTATHFRCAQLLYQLSPWEQKRNTFCKTIEYLFIII